MQEQVVSGHAAKLTSTAFRMFNRMSHRLYLPRVLCVAHRFVPVMLHADLRVFNVEGDRSPSSFIVLIALRHKNRQQVPEDMHIDASKHVLLVDWLAFGILELRTFGLALIAASAVT